ncbi:MAG: hypothetical protein AAF645_12745 [Myxococcota bacterium]
MRIEWAVAALLFTACGDDSAATDAGVDQRILDGAPAETGADAAPEQGADSSEDTSPDTGDDAGGQMPFTAHTEAPFTPNACCGAEVNTALDASGRVHVFAHQQRGSTRSQWYLVQNGDDWNSTNITEDGSLPRPFSERSAFTLDAGDAPHGLFSIGDGTLHYAFLDGTWQAIPIGDSNVGNMFTHFDIAVDAGGDVHVVWFDRRTLALRYGRRNGDAFDVETVDPPADGDQNGEYARIAVASDGTLHLSYLAIVGDAPILRHASGGAGSWSVEDVPGENKGVFGTILLNGEDRPMIASAGLVSSRAQGLYVSRFDGSWSETSNRLT